MDIHTRLLTKVFIAWSLSLFLWSCATDESGNATTEIEQDALNSLNRKISIYSELTNEDRETLLHIMEELDEIADEAFAMGKERLFNGEVEDMKMVDKIKYRLATVQTELNQARQKAVDNPSLQAIIEDLQQQIISQDDYIGHLKTTVETKADNLQKKYNQLKKKKDELIQAREMNEEAFTRLNQEKTKLDQTKSSSWAEVGDKLVASANQLQIVKKHGKQVKRSKEAKKRILLRAIECYQKATELGDATASQKANNAEKIIQTLNAE